VLHCNLRCNGARNEVSLKMSKPYDGTQLFVDGVNRVNRKVAPLADIGFPSGAGSAELWSAVSMKCLYFPRMISGFEAGLLVHQ
jgi:hypothetical protein